MSIDREALREKVARAIARANGDEFANAFKNKDRWNAKRGMSGGRFRDINEPFQSDYLAMADAALAALDQPAQEPVLWVSQATCDRLAAHGFVEVIARRVRDDKYTVPLYAAPHPTTLPDESR